MMCLSRGSPTQPERLDDVVVMLKAGRYASAEPFLRQMLQSQPTAEVKYLLGVCLMGQYDSEQAEPFLREAVGERPKEHVWLHTLAKSLMEQGHNLEAIEALDKAIAISPLPEYRFSKAMSAYNIGDLSLAENELRRCARDPKLQFFKDGQIVDQRGEALYQLGKILELQGREQDAVEQFHQCLSVQPEHLEARFHLGMAYKKDGRHKEALEAFEWVLAKVPSHLGAHYNLYRTLMALGLEDEGRRRLQELKALAKVEDEIQFHLSSAEAIEHTLKDGVGGEAERLELVEKRLTLGRLLFEAGRTEDAVEHLLAARRLDPQRSHTYRLLAEAFRRLGRQSDAARAETFAQELEKQSR